MKSNVMIAMAILVFGNLFSALYDVSIKWMPDDSNAATFLLIRQVLSVLMLMPLWFYAKRPTTKYLKVHFFRSNTGALGAVCLIMGLMSLPIATVSSLFFSAPLMIVLMGSIFLKEKVTPTQWLATILGFIGILILLRPSEINWFGVAVLISAFTFALNQLALRKLPDTENPSVTLMLYNTLSIPLTLVMVLVQGFEGVSWALIGIAALSNSFLLAYHWLCVLAYRKAEASKIAIAEYTGLLFCVLFGWLLFDEWLDGLSWVGAGFIVLPSLIIPWVTARIAYLRPKKIIEQKAG
ncbi:DMT family transporter [Shewanella schlegeliana]|uniref:DMT family transporter n=1 Tax=Shewanella schlegeliana TaxID=190308 RepID=A0ABS1T2L8_9GAMM|nr:DMT family transporter [Shewanella schlegeliana]MBL4915046.1 DMT family transporter [Shewanella schlegeliana]MCL1110542.1 DMT family transporter [Shewanella schlegeliana]GIU32390.1 membrane protein [Shewanella schlegeliana]